MEITASFNVLGVILIVWTETAVVQSTDTCIAGKTQVLYVSPLSYKKTTTSPNYPQRYPRNTECSWRIEIPPNYSESYVVKVVFNDFDLLYEHNWGCQLAHTLSFYDGASSMSNIIGTYCGTVHPDVIYSTGQSLYVKFDAWMFTAIYSSRGFNFSYSAVKKEEASAICHPSSYLVSDVSRVNGSSGTFFSPGYPAPYPNDAICIWILTVPPGKRVKLTFESFELKSSHIDCPKGKDYHNDFVLIRDGQASTNFEIGRYCEYNTPSLVPADLFSTGRYMWVKFRSGEGHIWGNVKGFKAHFEAVDQTVDINSMKVCFPGNVNNDNLILAGDKGTLKSPLDLYPPDMNCSWLITVPKGKIVKLIFKRFQLDVNNMGPCGDYVEVLDGKHTSSKRLGKYCGDAKETPGTFRSSGRYMRVNFLSDSNDLERYEGFEATFNSVPVDERKTAHVMMALGLGISAGVMLLILMVVCLVCNSKRKRARNRAARGAGMSVTTASTSASHSQQPSAPPQAANQPANSPYPTPPVGYAPVPSNTPPPAYPYLDIPPPPYPGEEGVPQYPPPGQPYPWLQKGASAEPSAPPISP